MNKAQAQQAFWEEMSGLPTYNFYTVPDDAPYPRCTYIPFSGSMGTPTMQTASLWYRESTWANIWQKAFEMEKKIAEQPPSIKIDTGRYKVRLPGDGMAFATPMGEPEDDLVRRLVLNVEAEFLTPY